jgi:microcystin degradation protein MlrC
MSLEKPRIAIMGMHLESNAFAPVTTRDDFYDAGYFEGEDILIEAAKKASSLPVEIHAFIEAMNTSGSWEPVPILITGTEPGGPAEQSFIDETLARMRIMLAEAGPLDGIYVSNHGAMTSTGGNDPDGELYALAREMVGADQPVVATVDLHANISYKMVHSVDAIISYRTNPHIDQRERAAEAAYLMRRLLSGERLEKTWIRMPIAAPSVTLLTAQGAYADMIAEGQRHLSQHLSIVSIIGGFAFADTRENGLTILTYGSGSIPRKLALKLAEMAWAERERFCVQLTSIDEAIGRAVEAAAGGPIVCLADVADNPGGGGRGNTTDILEGLLTSNVQHALYGNFVDPAVAKRCHDVGVGSKFQIIFNETNADSHGRAVPTEIEVIGLSDGNIAGRRGIYKGRTVKLGLAAVVRSGGLTILVCSRRVQCADPAFFEAFSLDIGTFRSLTVKSRGHFRAGFDEYYAHDQILEVNASGLTSPMLERFSWKTLPRPIWPLDKEIQWTPPKIETL